MYFIQTPTHTCGRILTLFCALCFNFIPKKSFEPIFRFFSISFLFKFILCLHAQLFAQSTQHNNRNEKNAPNIYCGYAYRRCHHLICNDADADESVGNE